MKKSYEEIVNATNKGFAQQSLHVIDIQREFFDDGALAVAGEEKLRIWPDHCIAGTTDHML